MSNSNKSLFLQQSQNLINELKKIIPNDSNILLFEEKFYAAKKMNSDLIINAFINYVLPHKDQVMSKNEDFFLKGGGQENLGEDKDQYVLDLKDKWGKFNDTNKAVIWKFFQVLVILSERHIIERMKE
jgi:hypothetical protein